MKTQIIVKCIRTKKEPVRFTFSLNVAILLIQFVECFKEHILSCHKDEIAL